jgi:hypothetical protein
VSAAVSYLQAQTSTATPFATVLSTYALALACETTGSLGCEGLGSALDTLEAAAVMDSGLSHWQTGESAPVSPYGAMRFHPASLLSHNVWAWYSKLCLWRPSKGLRLFPQDILHMYAWYLCDAGCKHGDVRTLEWMT